MPEPDRPRPVTAGEPGAAENDDDEDGPALDTVAIQSAGAMDPTGSTAAFAVAYGFVVGAGRGVRTLGRYLGRKARGG